MEGVCSVVPWSSINNNNLLINGQPATGPQGEEAHCDKDKMASTGDVSNNLSKLRSQLRRIKYGGQVDTHRYVPPT